MAETGRAWALAINEHTSNRSLWQYVHDAYAHIEEDILVHGTGDRNDDAILEKGNRRKKRLGDRCVFRGGKNATGSKFRQSYRVKERDEKGVWTGNYVTKYKSRLANTGQAGQVLTLDLIAQICESTRASASASLSVPEIQMKEEEKAKRAVNRDATEKALIDFKASA